MRIDEIGDQCAEGIVVAELDFVGGDGVVLVDDRNDVVLEQRQQRPWRGPIPVPRVTVILTVEQTQVALKIFPVLAGVWMIGTILLLWRFRRGWSLLLRRLDKAVIASPKTRRMLAEVGKTMHWDQSVECRQSDMVEAPVVAGVWRPMIVVPAHFDAAFPEEERRMLLAHELAHLIRRDPLRQRDRPRVHDLSPGTAVRCAGRHPATWANSGRTAAIGLRSHSTTTARRLLARAIASRIVRLATRSFAHHSPSIGRKVNKEDTADVDSVLLLRRLGLIQAGFADKSIS